MSYKYKIKLKMFLKFQNVLSLIFLTMLGIGYCTPETNIKRIINGEQINSVNNNNNINNINNTNHNNHNNSNNNNSNLNNNNNSYSNLNNINNNNIIKESQNIDLISNKIENPRWLNGYFTLVDYLPDGEMERRIYYNGITAKETSVGNNTKSVKLWQFSNGKTFYQLIYSTDNELIDCEYLKQKNLVLNFLDTFYTEVNAAYSRNFTSPYIVQTNRKSHITDREFRQFIDNDILTNEMKEYKEDLDTISAIPTYDAFGMRNLTYTQIKDESDLPEDLLYWMNNYNKLKGQCDKRHHDMKQILRGLNSKHQHIKNEAKNNLERKKREITDLLIAPNTKWCGRGQNAVNYNQLGGSSRADKCCRKHDHCKLYIRPFTSKWQLFNYRPFTLSHCSCDMRKKRDLTDLFMIPNTKWCGRGRTAGKYTQLGGATRADKCCRKHDHCKLFIHSMTSDWGLFNYRPYTISHCNCDMRKRRDLTNVMRMPGTSWCGKGDDPHNYAKLGGLSKLDRCCRQHDRACPYWIPGFDTKFGLFNYRVISMLHCKCDERFRTCLKIADCPDANMVGKLFFNIVQSKCFLLKREKYCKKHVWWQGECEKVGYKKRAHIRNNRPY